MPRKNRKELEAEKINASEVARIDRIALFFLSICLFAVPIFAIFICAKKSDWAAWIQAVGSVEAIIASTFIAIGTHRVNIKAQRVRQAEEHVRVLANLKSLIEETYSYLVYVRDHAEGGLAKKDTAVLFPPRLGSSKSHWMSYGWKSADIRRSLSLFEKNLEQLSAIGFADFGDPFIARNILAFISYSKTLLEEVSTGWDMTESGEEVHAVGSEHDDLDPFKYRPGTPNLSPSEKKIGLSQTIARGFMGFYFKSDLPELISDVYQKLMIRFETECGT
ncbi:hypothetical protein PS623_01164 [Pseudomonas fluorescens]|uniref:hypothetical protein n=1 Tax=Pseudomonas fluorescens TaxID=294 RepID=UPI0012411A3E|nr:hypothetical protein [Pseudomonas fluorescens]VVM59160.1 hypothetical protein PS623_01164 [Pseudomonas fluorescens]